jgi:hypothetical protein
MKVSPITVCGWSVVAALVLCAGIYTSAQDSSGEGQSLGDAARKARQEHSAAGHVAASLITEFNTTQRDLANIHGVLG